MLQPVSLKYLNMGDYIYINDLNLYKKNGVHKKMYLFIQLLCYFYYHLILLKKNLIGTAQTRCFCFFCYP